ncbi:MAG: MBL fold metallo-hydrolase [Syntrophobacteraceae bacterium]
MPHSIPDASLLFETDEIDTSAGPLKVTFIGHASLMLVFGAKVIHVDPESRQADYSELPKADIILVTHEHRDHCDLEAIEAVSTGSTRLITNQGCLTQVKDRTVLRNGEKMSVEGIGIVAVPAYNLVHMRPEGVPYHARGAGNGYVLSFGEKRVYIAGDTENIPEMKDLGEIDIAFLPMNLPFTMTPEMVAKAARSFTPKVLYPYHFADTDPLILTRLLEGSGIEVRIRKMKYGEGAAGQ